MKISFKQNSKQVELIKAMASRSKEKSLAAQEAFAQLMGPVVEEVVNNADTTAMLFQSIPFDEGTEPTVPLDLYTDQQEGYFPVWTQDIAGGLASQLLVEPLREMRFTTYELASAYSFLRRYAEQSRVDVVAKAVTRILQEILLKRSINSWNVLLRALAEATHGGQRHVVRSQTANFFTLDDMNRLFTVLRRLNSSWAGGTPTVDNGKGLTDIFVSPEVKEFMRSWAYNPINTRGGNSTAITAGTDAAAGGVIALPDADRAAIFSGSGNQEIFGVTVHELLEFGVGRRYSVIFDQVAGAIQYALPDGTSPAVFDGSAEELVVGVDMTREFAYRPIRRDGESGSTVVFQPDDQFPARSKKLGFYAEVNEGAIVLNTKPLCGVIV